MPLDEYDLMADDDASDTVEVAMDLYTKQCMTANGFAYTAMTVGADSKKDSLGERTYGLWNVAKAARFGFVPVGADESEPSSSPEKNQDWHDALEACGDAGKSTTDTFYSDLDNPRRQLIDRLVNSASTAASRDPESKKAWDDWTACIEKRGLKRASEAGSVMSQQAEAAIKKVGEDGSSPVKEEEIRVATIEAQCDHDTKKTQRLADLEAAYQLPLIKENQAALNEAKAEMQKKLKAARDYIAKHG